VLRLSPIAEDIPHTTAARDLSHGQGAARVALPAALLRQLISEDEAKARGPASLADRYLPYQHAGENEYTLVARTRSMSPKTASAVLLRLLQDSRSQVPGTLDRGQRSTAEFFTGSAPAGINQLTAQGR
jgi:hypothetical protein